MSGLGSYIWFVGLAACLALLAVAYVVADMRRRKAGTLPPGNPNQAWEQAARESNQPEVAQPTATDTRVKG